jgi:hypothetical protein
MKQHINKEVGLVVITLVNHANCLRLKCEVTVLLFLCFQTQVTRTKLFSSKCATAMLPYAVTLCISASNYDPQFIFSHPQGKGYKTF